MLVMMIQPILIMAALDHSHLKVIKQLCVRSTIEGHSRAKLGWILPHDDNSLSSVDDVYKQSSKPICLLLLVTAALGIHGTCTLQSFQTLKIYTCSQVK